MTKHKAVFKMPAVTKISARTSTMTNAFVHAIIPVIYPTDEDIEEVLQILGMTENTVCCAYCGAPHTEWDHFFNLVQDKEPTGFISEIWNLVPSCSKCNSSKGSQYWEAWMRSDAKLSPKSRGIKDLEERIRRLKSYEALTKTRRTKLNFAEIAGDLWKKHKKNEKQIIELMKKSQKYAEDIKKVIDAAQKKSANETHP